MSRPVLTAAPAGHLADHRKARAHQRVEEASHICRERALYARMSVSRAIERRGWPRGTGSIVEPLGGAGAPVRILGSADRPGAS